MKNKKGFTLIELLAVILILAIIALIAIPVVNKIVKEAKKGAAEASAVNYVDAVEKVSAKAMLDEDTSLSFGTFDVSFLNTKVDISGTLPLSGNVTLNSDGVVIAAILCLSDYVVNYIDSKAKVDETKNCDDMTEVVTIYKDDTLNGADPELGSNMIPVIITDDGTVTSADINNKWYDYTNKVWANVVEIVNNETYNVGEIIPESEIESYFVWIPRFKYKIFNLGNYTSVISGKSPISNMQTIEIVFETKDIAVSNGSTVDSYLTSPAFTSLDTNGIWVGKFETGYNGSTSTTTAQVISSDSSKIMVKPNVYSWRNNTVYNIFISSYNYDRNNDSHMMKNTEWGAVAYLSHSVYGINKELNINNNSLYKTGYSALLSTNQNIYPGTYGDGSTYNEAYNTEIGYLASTTGNITGIYDISGGAWEYTAAYMSGQLGSSGFNSTTLANYNSKYFDVYPSSSTATSYNKRKLGDATGEMGPFYGYADGDGSIRNHNNWYSVMAHFPSSTHPWFNRGGNNTAGVLADQFSFNRNTGAAYAHIGSRIVLAP